MKYDDLLDVFHNKEEVESTGEKEHRKNLFKHHDEKYDADLAYQKKNNFLNSLISPKKSLRSMSFKQNEDTNSNSRELISEIKSSLDNKN